MYRFVVLLIIIVSVLSCERKIIIKIPSSNNFTVSSILAKDSLLKLNIITPSKLVNNTKDYPDIKISVNNKKINTKLVVKDNLFILETNMKLKSDYNYNLNILIDNNKKISCSSEIPEKVEIENISVNRLSEYKKELYVEFTDDLNTNNYYMILIRNYYNPAIKVEYFSNDILFEGKIKERMYDINDDAKAKAHSYVFDDSLMVDTKVSVSLFVPVMAGVKFYVDLYSICKDYYLYEKSFIDAKNMPDVPSFSRDVIYSNISGADGIFISYAVDTEIINLEE